MSDYLDVFLNTTDYIKNSKDHSYLFFGPVNFRFFKIQTFSCVDDIFGNTPLFKGFQRLGHSMDCTHKDHVGAFRNTSGFYIPNLYNYTFLEEGQTGVEHYLSTPIGSYDRSGTVINLSTIR
jgi:hypothetical protein